MRDSKGRFLKGAKLPFNNKENRTEKQKIASLNNLKDYIGRVPPMLGKNHSEETKEKLKKVHIGLHIGEKNGMWIKDRSKLAKKQVRNDPAYFEWRKQVLIRDNYKCRINNQDCDCDLEVHHILSWREYEELRYQINNGITLCHTHHPRVRSEEKRLIPEFQKLVSVSKDNN